MMEGYHLQQRRPKLLAGQGIGTVQPVSRDAPALRDRPNGEAILEPEPKQFDALQLLGTIKVQQGQHAEGADLIGQALRINPNSARALLNLGFALLGLGRADEAAKSFDKALALDPGYVQALSGRGSALAKLHRPLEALIATAVLILRNPPGMPRRVLIWRRCIAKPRNIQ